jgi:hypothetical protein
MSTGQTLSIFAAIIVSAIIVSITINDNKPKPKTSGGSTNQSSNNTQSSVQRTYSMKDIISEL